MSEFELLKAKYEAVQSKLQALESERETLDRDFEDLKTINEALYLENLRLRRGLLLQNNPAEKVDTDQLRLAFGPVLDALAQEREAAENSDADAAALYAKHRSKKTKKGPKRKPTGRRPLPEHLETVEVVLKPTEVQLGDEADFVQISERTTEKIEYRRAAYVRVLIRRPVYVPREELEALAKEEPSKLPATLVAPPPAVPIPRALPLVGMLAHVIMGKYCDHIPLHRLAKILKRSGLRFNRSTLCGWIEGACGLLRHIYEAMIKDAHDTAQCIAIDATGTLVLAKERCRRCHFWVMIADHDHVIYRFTKKGKAVDVQSLLGDFSGYVIADAASVFNAFFDEGDATEVNCWAHCRRYFFNALADDEGRALIGIGFIGKLYGADRLVAKSGLEGEARTARRRELCGAVYDDFYEWVDQERLDLAKERPIRKALNYAANHRKGLGVFLEDATLRLDNNNSELALRHEVVGRKNWLFLGSDDGAEWNVICVSLIASCQLHDIEPEQYLREVLTLLPGWKRSAALELSPKHWKATRAREETQALLRELTLVADHGQEFRVAGTA